MVVEKRQGENRALIVAFLSRFAFIFSMQAMPPLFPMIIDEFRLSFTVTSSLLWLVAIPGLFISVLGGLLIGRHGIKRLLIAGLAISVLSSILSYLSYDLVILQFSRLMLGVGGALAVVAAATLLFEWFEKGNLGLAMGVFGLCMPSGIVSAFNILGVIAIGYGWRTAILITVAVNSVALVACFFWTLEKSDKHSAKLTLKPFRNRYMWILGFGWALFNMAALGYTTWGKTIFIEHYDFPMEFSGLLASVIMFGAFAQPLTGYISDKVGQRRSLAAVSCALITVIFLFFPFMQSIYFLPLSLILGIVVAFVTPALYALSGEILVSGNGALGLSVMNTFLNLGMILGPLFLGLILDFTSSNLVIFFTMAFFTLWATILITIRPRQLQS